MAYGQSLKAAGYPDRFIWQNQMLVGLDEGEALDRIWAINSYDGAGHDATVVKTEKFVADDTLAKLYGRVSGHPLLDIRIDTRRPARESAPQLSIAFMAVTEALMLDRERFSNEVGSLRTVDIPRLEGEIAALRAELASIRDANRQLEEELFRLRNGRVFRWSRPAAMLYHQLVRHR
jgi:cell division protein FtsB